ncbi:prepilin peptidase [Gimesia maris]|uniref:prepilin peptidase n=1 Tax=Gimesia maris TaxID=122 RepID=UPI0012B8FAB4|nr:A24 family peptidase [Gimesia maris]
MPEATINVETFMLLMLVPLALSLEAVYYDLQKREIPDGVVLRVLVTGLLATILSWHGVSFVNALLGMVTGFVIVLPFALAGGIGGGDLKFVGALGTWLGIAGVMSLLFWSAIFGMLVAIITRYYGRNDFPFAPAIVLGLCVAIFWPSGIDFLISWLRSGLL